LEAALYSLPEIDGAAPNAFLIADPESKMGPNFFASQYNIDDDGFEVFIPEEKEK